MVEFAQLKAIQTDLWIFDIDGTLYGDTHMKIAVTKRMDQFFAKMYGVDEQKGGVLREGLKKKHAVPSTVVALHREGILAESFIKETYLLVDCGVAGICPPTPLVTLVPHLQGEKIILTNSPSEFTWRILAALGLEKMFLSVYGVRELNYFLKPDARAFAPLAAAVQSGKRVVFIDDKAENLAAAKATGCMTRLWWTGRQLMEIEE